VLSAAFVAVTTQVCAEAELKSLPDIEQPFVDVAKVIAPPPVPPEVVNARVVPKVPEIEVMLRLL
jgi:hypothetical protein